MKLAELTVLSQSEIEMIHAQSLHILENAGVRVLDAECRHMLVNAGAKVYPMGDRVHLPKQLVEECRRTAPSGFHLYRRDGVRVDVGLDSCILGALVTDPWVIDFESQRPRRPVLADIVRHTRLGDALDNVDFLYRMDMPPEDVAGEEGYIRTLAAFALNTIKPMLAAPASQALLHCWLEMAEVLSDGRPLAERPFLVLSAPVTTPLTFHALNAEIMKAGVRRGLPMTAQTEPIAGTTAPLSFAGGTVMGNCENLFLVVMSQLLKPGAPIAYSTGNGVMDYRTGGDHYCPAEKMLWKIASGQMARFYRLPIAGEATGSLVGRYDTQNGIEHALQMLPPVLLGGGMFNGLGSCFNACGMSAELVVIHSDVARLIGRLRRGIEVNSKTLATDSIVHVGPGGHFLEQELTLENLRSGEFFNEGCFDRMGERSPNRSEDSMLARAHRRVEELLVTHSPAIPDSTAAEVDRWANKRCAELR